MRLLSYTAATPAEDLALEESIHLAVETGVSPPTWRLWIAQAPTVVLGTGQEANLEIDLEETKRRNVGVLRRHSGGGTVVIGPGTLNFSACYPYTELPDSETINGATRAALKYVMDVLALWNLQPSLAGYSDIALLCRDGLLRKIAGNSQARKKNTCVVHGTMLVDPDWDRIGGVLRFPSKVPEYRAGRAHRDFLTSLAEQSAPLTLEAFRDSLLKVLPAPVECTQQPSSLESIRAAELLSEKYGRDEWTFRR
jgi:lipoate---protein ligase